MNIDLQSLVQFLLLLGAIGSQWVKLTNNQARLEQEVKDHVDNKDIHLRGQKASVS